MKLWPWTLLFLLSSCVFQKLAIQQLDTFLRYEVGSKLALTGPQKKNLAADVSMFLKARQADVPALREALLKVDPADAASIAPSWRFFAQEYRRLLLEAGKIFARYLTELDPSQRTHLLATLRKDNDKARSKAPKQGAILWKKRIKHLFGQISPYQETLLKEHDQRLIVAAEVRVKRREALREQLQSILGGGQDPKAKEAAIVAAFTAYQDESLARSEEMLPLVEKLRVGLSNAQLEAFAKRRKDYAELLEYFRQTEY